MCKPSRDLAFRCPCATPFVVIIVRNRRLSMKRLTLALALLLSVVVLGQQATLVQHSAARIDGPTQFSTSASTGATLTLTPNAGESVYIYSIDMDACSNATGGTAGAVTTLAATSGINGNPSWTVGTGNTTAGAIGGPGLCNPSLKVVYPTGLRAQSPGVNVVFTLPTFA